MEKQQRGPQHRLVSHRARRAEQHYTPPAPTLLRTREPTDAGVKTGEPTRAARHPTHAAATCFFLPRESKAGEEVEKRARHARAHSKTTAGQSELASRPKAANRGSETTGMAVFRIEAVALKAFCYWTETYEPGSETNVVYGLK
ncbi:hypothetical protein MRX96_017934 [Rhipicephalus microplus]